MFELTTLSDKFALLLALISLIYVWRAQSNKKQRKFAPGPKPHWLWGNFYDFPSLNPYMYYADMAKKYGDVLHFEAFGQHIMVLNTDEAAVELLERRSKFFSDRPASAMLKATSWSVWNMALAPYGSFWREQRKLAKHYLDEEHIAQYSPVHIKRTEEFLNNLLETPDNFFYHIRTMTTGSIMSITYAYDVDPKTDQFVTLADDAISYLSRATVFKGSIVVNEFGFLHYLPSWMNFQKHLAKTRDLALQMRTLPYEHTRKQWEEGTAPPSILNQLLTTTKGEQAIALRDLAGSLYSGGADTTPSAIATFFLAMASNPEAQKQGQAEIDRVIGHDRLPDHGDRASLPYVTAIMAEVLRRGPLAPMSGAHVATDEDVYNGFFIPKGTIIMTNIWSINHDERKYKDPFEFNPSRYLDADGELIEGFNTKESLIYGHGRRKCPGRYMADSTLWLTIAYLLATFDMTEAKYEDGKIVNLRDAVFIDGAFSRPKPFSCTIKSRSEQSKKLILDARARA